MHSTEVWLLIRDFVDVLNKEGEQRALHVYKKAIEPRLLGPTLSKLERYADFLPWLKQELSPDPRSYAESMLMKLAFAPIFPVRKSNPGGHTAFQAVAQPPPREDGECMTFLIFGRGAHNKSALWQVVAWEELTKKIPQRSEEHTKKKPQLPDQYCSLGLSQYSCEEFFRQGASVARVWSTDLSADKKKWVSAIVKHREKGDLNVNAVKRELRTSREDAKRLIARVNQMFKGHIEGLYRLERRYWLEGFTDTWEAINPALPEE